MDTMCPPPATPGPVPGALGRTPTACPSQGHTEDPAEQDAFRLQPSGGVCLSAGLGPTRRPQARTPAAHPGLSPPEACSEPVRTGSSCRAAAVETEAWTHSRDRHHREEHMLHGPQGEGSLRNAFNKVVAFPSN